MPRPKRILVADDQGVNRKLTVRRLQLMGFEVDAVENGLQVIEILARGEYDLIFMDCHMPHLDGFQATRWIRNREGAKLHTPIVAFTATVSVADRERCLAAGMDEFVSKPVEESELLRVVRRWLPDARTTDRLAAIDRNELVAIFLADVPSRVAAIREALSARDAKQIAEAAHALKSGSGNVGATRVYGLCDELEKNADDPAAAAAIFGQIEAEFRNFKNSS